MSEQAIIPLSGQYVTAKVFTYNIDSSAVSQVINICNQPYASGSQIRIMPDVHAGDGAVVGFTMTIKDKVVPALVGSDIGCGNEDWNFSAPHGAGRLVRRSEAKESISLTDYRETMKGIYSSSVNQSTIDDNL